MIKIQPYIMYYCPICKGDFTNKRDLKVHFKEVHDTNINTLKFLRPIDYQKRTLWN